MPYAKSPTDSPEELKEKIESFLLELRHPVLTETGKEVVDLSASNYSLSTEYNKLLWHIWNERTNLVRQVTGVRKASAGRMELRFQKFGKGPPGTLILAESRAGTERLERRSERSRYAQALKRFLAQLFPQWKIESLNAEPDLQHSFSGLYTRGVLSKGQLAWAVIGAGEHEDPQAAEGILTYGLIWLDWLRRRETRRVFAGLKIFVPSKRSSTTLQRLAWLDSKAAQWELYETGSEIWRLDPADFGNLKTTFAPVGEPFALLAAAERSVERAIQRIQALSPAIEIHFGSENFRVLTLLGLPFAKETAGGLVFGLGRAETPLGTRTFGELKLLVEKILHYRCPQPEDRLHPYFRLQPEKWMQSMLVRRIDVLGYDLAPDAIYEQVPAVSGGEGGLMDLLAVSSQGRLVVVEFKASEDIHLPLQALDYWMRVHWHQKRGELVRQGYFPQRTLSAREPLLLLVSPALQFHPACETVLRYFSPLIEAVRVGLNENWRDGLQVMFRIER